MIVVGGGPAGCTAAAAAAREGAKTLLVEATGSLGGMGTGGLVPAWCPFSDKEKIIYRGLAQTVLDRCKAGMPHVADDATDWVPIDPELLKRIYDDLVTEYGTDVLFNSLLCGVGAPGKECVAVQLGDATGPATDCTFMACRIRKTPLRADNAKGVKFIGCTVGNPGEEKFVGKDADSILLL